MGWVSQLRNRGAFGRGLFDRGVQVRAAGERMDEVNVGGIAKRTWRRVCREQHVIGKSDWKTAMAIIVSEKNYVRR